MHDLLAQVQRPMRLRDGVDRVANVTDGNERHTLTRMLPHRTHVALVELGGTRVSGNQDKDHRGRKRHGVRVLEAEAVASQYEQLRRVAADRQHLQVVGALGLLRRTHEAHEPAHGADAQGERP